MLQGPSQIQQCQVQASTTSSSLGKSLHLRVKNWFKDRVSVRQVVVMVRIRIGLKEMNVSHTMHSSCMSSEVVET